ncbi:alpha/beta hydrolase domain-containing protein VTE7-like isoform X2 [Solanum dulcamara]|uniref:alpha/beta hydrolase domain-containing protein VTE7-like isoform X2 n=1 Tax=Solanum dulcamara TaxID=45834 RepID=UPI00248525EA|nr:alpha/beta hydrolase domain-containing protein VTE7-like isoform X2 [Solanum dulcamara]
MLTLLSAGAGGSPPPAFHLIEPNLKWSNSRRLRIWAGEFPDFLPKQVEKIKDPYARKLASRIDRIPVNLSKGCVMSSCVKPKEQTDANPVVLLHGFDSSCLEWRYTLPMLEEAGLETWAVDILGWGFSDLGRLPLCDVASKRDHLYQCNIILSVQDQVHSYTPLCIVQNAMVLYPVMQHKEGLWSTYIKRPMVLVGPSLGSAVAIDFSVKYPEAVHRLVLIDASVYTEGTGNLATLPKAVAYAGIGRLHCSLPWWEDALVNFMISGGYNVISQIEHVKQNTLIIWGEDDQIIDYKLAVRLHCELPNAILRQIPKCGHIPHVEKPDAVSRLIVDFVRPDQAQRANPESVPTISVPA